MGRKSPPAGVDEVSVADLLRDDSGEPPQAAEPSHVETQKERFVRIAKRVGVWSLKWGKRASIVIGVLSIIGFVVLWRVVVHYEEGLPSVTELKGNYHPSQVTRVLARDGTLLAELFTERRTVVSIAVAPRAREARRARRRGRRLLRARRAQLLGHRARVAS